MQEKKEIQSNDTSYSIEISNSITVELIPTFWENGLIHRVCPRYVGAAYLFNACYECSNKTVIGKYRPEKLTTDAYMNTFTEHSFAYHGYFKPDIVEVWSYLKPLVLEDIKKNPREKYHYYITTSHMRHMHMPEPEPCTKKEKEPKHIGWTLCLPVERIKDFE